MCLDAILTLALVSPLHFYMTLNHSSKTTWHGFLWGWQVDSYHAVPNDLRRLCLHWIGKCSWGACLVQSVWCGPNFVCVGWKVCNAWCNVMSDLVWPASAGHMNGPELRLHSNGPYGTWCSVHHWSHNILQGVYNECNVSNFPPRYALYHQTYCKQCGTLLSPKHPQTILNDYQKYLHYNRILNPQDFHNN